MERAFRAPVRPMFTHEGRERFATREHQRELAIRVNFVRQTINAQPRSNTNADVTRFQIDPEVMRQAVDLCCVQFTTIPRVETTCTRRQHCAQLIQVTDFKARILRDAVGRGVYRLQHESMHGHESVTPKLPDKESVRHCAATKSSA